MFCGTIFNGQDPEEFWTVLHFDDRPVRMFYINGKPWWALTDVCNLIDLGNTSRTASRLEDYEKMTITLSNSHSGQRGGAQKLLVINESGLYHLLFTSDKPLAKAFLGWVTVDVVPSIRRNGGYIMGQESMGAAELTSAAKRVVRNVSTEQAQIRDLRLQSEAQAALLREWEPKIRYHDAVLQSRDAVPTTVIAKDYGLSAQALNAYLHDRGVQYKCGGTWVLYQRYAGRGYTHPETILCGPYHCTQHTRWTPEGRFFIYQLLRGDGILPLSERPNVSGDIEDFWLP